MSLYHRNSGLTWPQYLKSQAFVDNIKDGIHRAGKAMSSKIDEQTDDIVASNEALGESISAGLDQLDSALQSGFGQANETLRNGFERMEYGLDRIAYGIAGLRSDFNWAMGGLLHKLDIQNLLLKDIYVELRIPDFQKERRYYVEQGCKHYKNGLYQESLETFLKAEPLEKTDPFVLYSLGQIYLYQPNMIDMDKAQDYFTRAGKYYVAEKKNKQAGESYFHAGIAAYLRRDDVNAPQFAKKASELYPELLEAFYNHAKFLAVQGNDSGLLSLELAIRKDRNYALKVTADSDFASFSAQLQVLLDKLKREAKADAEKAIADLERELDEYVIVDEKVKEEMDNVISPGKVTALLSKDHYFDYLDYIIAVQDAQKRLKSIPVSVKELYTLGDRLRVNSVKFSSDGVIMASLFGAVTLWDTKTGKELRTITDQNQINSISFSPNGMILAGGSNDETVKFWDVQTGKKLNTLTGHSNTVSGVDFSPNGVLLASGSWDMTVKLWEVKTGKELYTIRMSDYVYCVIFSPDGLLLAIGLKNNTVKLLDVKMGKELLTLTGYNHYMNSCIAFSPDGLILSIVSDNKTIRLWDVQTGNELHTITVHSSRVRSISFSSNGLILASGAEGNTNDDTLNTVQLWDIQTGKELLTIETHLGTPNSVAFSPDSLMLACWLYEGKAILWALEYKVISKAQLKRQEELRCKMEEVRRTSAEEQRRKGKEEEYLRQQEQWRSEGRCEVCGGSIGFWFSGISVRCKKHR